MAMVAHRATAAAIWIVTSRPIKPPSQPTATAAAAPVRVPRQRPQIDRSVASIVPWETIRADIGAQTGCRSPIDVAAK